MDGEYEPELGQAIFGQPHQRFAGSKMLEAALASIDDELCRVMWNRDQAEYASPFHNTGNRFENDVFKAHAYSWNDDDQPWNFKWQNVEVSWYKHFRRGLSVNRAVPLSMVEQMLNECLASLRKMDRV